jgi:hypothetical protein
MRGGGEAFIPNEPFAPYGAKTLLPVRNLTLWSYTDLSDSRWSFDDEFIRLRVDESKPEPQKIGVLNRQGWVKYKVGDLVFTKRFDFVENAAYPDMNSNTEIYTAGSFVELETLAPLRRLAPAIRPNTPNTGGSFVKINPLPADENAKKASLRVKRSLFNF